jgi:hypothetical protein
MSREEIVSIVQALNELQEKFDIHMRSSSEFQTRAQPLLDALAFVQTIQKFLKWGGIPFFAFLGMVYWLIKKV